MRFQDAVEAFDACNRYIHDGMTKGFGYWWTANVYAAMLVQDSWPGRTLKADSVIKAAPFALHSAPGRKGGGRRETCNRLRTCSFPSSTVPFGPVSQRTRKMQSDRAWPYVYIKDVESTDRA